MELETQDIRSWQVKGDLNDVKKDVRKNQFILQ